MKIKLVLLPLSLFVFCGCSKQATEYEEAKHKNVINFINKCTESNGIFIIGLKSINCEDGSGNKISTNTKN